MRLYDQLTKGGLNVFNSEFALQNHAGSEYAPIIMAETAMPATVTALPSARRLESSRSK